MDRGSKKVFSAIVYLSTSFSFPPLFLQVKVKTWLDGTEGEEIGGLSAAFGTLLPTKEKDGVKLPATYTNPLNCCSNISQKVCLPHSRNAIAFI